VYVRRGLSPGTQKVLTLTESERVRLGLKPDRDVVRCITSLRHMLSGQHNMDNRTFEKFYLKAGKKCWLINTSKKAISDKLRGYLDSVPNENYQTSTCQSREEWWKFAMPKIPDILVSTGFRNKYTKVVVNSVGARAVGSVCGVYGLNRRRRIWVANGIRTTNIGDGVVAHSNGLRKIEINQLNTVLKSIMDHESKAI
jgi:hypothetical protein